MLRGHFLTTKVMGNITFFFLKPQQTTGLSMITCQGYSNQHTHQGRAPWMIPPVSLKLSKEFVVAEGCVKDYLEYLTLLDLKKDERRKGILFNNRYRVLHKKREVHSALVKMKRNTYLLMMKAFKQTLTRVQRMMMRKGMIFRSQ